MPRDISAGRDDKNPLSERTIVYGSVGDTLIHYELDRETASLTRSDALTMPSVIQYAWPHPSGRFLYVVTTDSARGSRAITGGAHTLCALRIDRGGALSPHGAPRMLRQRPIHTSVDRSGRYVLTCYNAPPHLTVHPIATDGSLGDAIPQPADLDLGIFCHQIQTTPSNRAVVMVTRGNNPKGEHPGDPGALKLFHFDQGHLSPFASIAPGGRGGLGYGPRHLDFHPTKPWAYVLVELQNQLHMHRMSGDAIAPEPAFIKSATEYPPKPGIVQVAGAIHVHPRGHVVYASNRVSATTHPEGAFPFVGGENNIAVFSLNPETGEPTPIQFADPHGFHVRAFAVDPSGRCLIAASLAAMTEGGDPAHLVPAGLSVFRIADDGRLHFASKLEVALGNGVQQMWVGALALPGRSG